MRQTNQLQRELAISSQMGTSLGDKWVLALVTHNSKLRITSSWSAQSTKHSMDVLHGVKILNKDVKVWLPTICPKILFELDRSQAKQLDRGIKKPLMCSITLNAIISLIPCSDAARFDPELCLMFCCLLFAIGLCEGETL